MPLVKYNTTVLYCHEKNVFEDNDSQKFVKLNLYCQFNIVNFYKKIKTDIIDVQNVPNGNNLQM